MFKGIRFGSTERDYIHIEYGFVGVVVDVAREVGLVA